MNWYYQYLLAQINKECGSIFGNNMTLQGGRGSAKSLIPFNVTPTNEEDDDCPEEHWLFNKRSNE